MAYVTHNSQRHENVNRVYVLHYITSLKFSFQVINNCRTPSTTQLCIKVNKNQESVMSIDINT